MDGCAKGAKTMTTEKRNDNLHKASSILSVGAILLTIALFVRIETVVHDTKIMDSKFTLEIQQIKDALKEEKDTRQARVKENFDALSGDVGIPGHPGPKGDAGESISVPEVIVSPASLTVTQNQTATFYCSADGNPEPSVSWSKLSGTGLVNTDGQGNKLQMKSAGYNDSGSYACTAANVLGEVKKVVKLFVEVPPQFIETPDRVIKVTANSLASVSCRAFGFPPPTIVWSRGLVPLPGGRTAVANGTLNISNFGPQDVGTYLCKATNKLGSVEALTTLRYVQPGFWMDSAILTDNAFYQTRLYEFLSPAIGSNPQWVLCYRASTHGWSISTFHSKCDGKRDTVTIIKKGQYVFGGYTDISWESSGGYSSTSNAFIFSLRNKEGLGPFKSMVTRASRAIERTTVHGPTFGGGHDICINDYANSNSNSYTNFGDSYSVPSGVQDRKTILAGSYKFTPVEVEVFYLG
ncbi:neural cell adhesion molecule 2-like isoform X2 [Orbicella faveolata]|uniref:neural cell adhesion molecule 2-like isoform X2 n=1 Tax=Orbicella faveolata TaxID=48498 RepID=UPI0009E30DEF|nr:neural cell adhesion molecule 2-like isoform X2 [Orbicella faveolata]